MNLIAVDIGGTKTLFCHVIDGDISAEETWPSDFHNWNEFLACLNKFAAGKDVEGIAVASAGMIVDNLVRPLNTSVLTFVNNINVVDSIGTSLGLSCYLINDAAAAAYGEFVECVKRGEVMSDGNVLYITISTGIGCGLVLNGLPLTSKTGLASHAGHIKGLEVPGTIDQFCSCGTKNCIEGLSSGAAIGRIASSLLGTDINAKQLLNSLNHTELSKRLITQSTRQIAYLIEVLNMSLGIDIVVIGGSVGMHSKYFESLIELNNKRELVVQPKIKIANLKKYSSVYGVSSLMGSHIKTKNCTVI